MEPEKKNEAMEPEKKNETSKTVEVVIMCVCVSIPLLAAVAGYKYHEMKTAKVTVTELYDALQARHNLYAALQARHKIPAS